MLGLCGAVLTALGDVLGVFAARGAYPRLMLTLSVVAWGACGPVWCAMSRAESGGFVAPVAAWEVASALCSCVLALALREQQTYAQWIGLGLVLMGAAVRSVGGAK